MFSAVYGITLVVALFDFPNTVYFIFLALPLIWLSATDLRCNIIPDVASLWIGILGLSSMIHRQDPFLVSSIITSALTALALWGGSEIYWRARQSEAFGLGDTKLVAAGALVVGVMGLPLMIFLASLGGIFVALLRKQNRRKGIPFGPFLAYSMFLIAVISDRGWT